MRAGLPARLDAIVIGASAGGVDALGSLLPALPVGLRAAVFVVLHIPREWPSRLVEVFQPRCALPVREVVDKLPIASGTVYLAPPDYHLLIDRGPQLSLSADEPVNFSRPSIDVLFETAADVYAERLLGIILTGWNADGAAGLAAVQRAGGVTVVQDPRSAHAPSMPAAALERNPGTDFVLPLDGIAELLRSLAEKAAP